MITIEGKYSKAIIYADELDPGAEGLIKAFCGSPASEGTVIRIMPDVHSGKGCAVGTTVKLADRVSPGLVGTDIGCGMTAAKITGKRIEMQKLDKLVHEKIPAGAKIRGSVHRFAESADFLDGLRCARHVRKEKALLSVGTLGGGNHFIELDRGEDGAYWIVVHSGSRGLGAEIEKYYHDLAYSGRHDEDVPYELAYLEGGDMEDYLHDSSLAAEFAALNRDAMIDEIVRGMKLDIMDSFSSRHNYIDTESMILRKGAVSAGAGERLIIPMNMRDGCLLCIGKGNTEWNSSAPHGAGRLMSRSDAKQSFTLSQFKKEMKEVYSTTVSRETLDESPMAYKPMERIISRISDTVEITGIIKPVYNFKAGSE